MTTFKFIINWSILGLIFTIFVSCNSTKVESVTDEEDEYEIIHAEMQYFDFDIIKDLPAFFDSISSIHGIPRWSPNDDETYIKGLSKCIERIDAFRKSDSKYFPDSIVRRCINSLGYNCAVIDNHGPGVDMTFAEWFLMLVAFYSPDITCLVHMQTPNHQAGVLNFGSSYNYNPWWSYIFLKREKGFEVRRIKENEIKIEKIFQIVDDNHRLYYLCSNNQSQMEFLQVLYWVRDKNDVLIVAECDSLPVDEKIVFEKCYYNPEKKAWYCCNIDKQSGKLIPISDRPTLILKLNGDKSIITNKQ